MHSTLLQFIKFSFAFVNLTRTSLCLPTMKRIALLSDTHGYLDKRIVTHLEEVDEVWHAGDIGNIAVTDTLEGIKPLKAVYGNIDGQEIRLVHPKDQVFKCEGLQVWMTHIGGYPNKYHPFVKERIKKNPPDLFICGHSHILKVQHDKQLNLLHLNPGACGVHGFHKVRTMMRFNVEQKQVKDLEIIELSPRHGISADDRLI